jgi:hypothetical protein
MPTIEYTPTELANFWAEGWGRLTVKYAAHKKYRRQWRVARARRDRAMNIWRAVSTPLTIPTPEEFLAKAEELAGDTFKCRLSRQKEITFTLPEGVKEVSVGHARKLKRLCQTLQQTFYRVYPRIPDHQSPDYLGTVSHSLPFYSHALRDIIEQWFPGLKVHAPDDTTSSGYRNPEGVYFSPRADILELSLLHDTFAHYAESRCYVAVYNYKDKLCLSLSDFPTTKYRSCNVPYPLEMPLTREGFMETLTEAMHQSIPYRRSQHPLPEGLIPAQFKTDRHPQTAMYSYYSSFHDFNGRDRAEYPGDLVAAVTVAETFKDIYPEGSYTLRKDEDSVGFTLYDKLPYSLETFKATLHDLFPSVPDSSFKSISGTHASTLFDGGVLHPKLKGILVGLLEFSDLTKPQIALTRSIFTISTGSGHSALLPEPLTANSFVKAALCVLSERG